MSTESLLFRIVLVAYIPIFSVLSFATLYAECLLNKYTGMILIAKLSTWVIKRSVGRRNFIVKITDNLATALIHVYLFRIHPVSNLNVGESCTS